MIELFGHESRALQDQFDTRRLADRIVERFVREELNDEQIECVNESFMLFISTVDAKGRPECSYKGGRPGFVKVIDERTLAIPFYNGNGLFITLGNLIATGKVSLLFVDFDKQYRLRVNGTARVEDPPDNGRYPGALKVATVTADFVYDLCERYVHKMQLVETSVFCPAEEYEPPPAPYLEKSLYDGYRPGEGVKS